MHPTTVTGLNIKLYGHVTTSNNDLIPSPDITERYALNRKFTINNKTDYMHTTAISD